MANPKLVLDNDAIACGLPYHSPAEEILIDTTAPQEQAIFTLPKTLAFSHTFIREAMGDRDLPEEVIDTSFSPEEI